jgi:hypothetical protein
MSYLGFVLKLANILKHRTETDKQNYTDSSREATCMYAIGHYKETVPCEVQTNSAEETGGKPL